MTEKERDQREVEAKRQFDMLSVNVLLVFPSMSSLHCLYSLISIGH